MGQTASPESAFEKVNFLLMSLCPFLFTGTTVGATNTASVISTAPMITTATSSPSLSPSPTAILSTTAESKVGIHAQPIATQAPVSIATTLGTGQLMVAAPSLSAALQGATQLPNSASFAAMAAAAGLNPGLMASSHFAPGLVLELSPLSVLPLDGLDFICQNATLLCPFIQGGPA